MRHDVSTADFDGAWYDPVEDRERLKSQMGRVFKCLADHAYQWLTVREISSVINSANKPYAPENSIQAQVRNLRKPKHGNWIIEARYREGTKTAEYRIIGKRQPKPAVQETLL